MDRQSLGAIQGTTLWRAPRPEQTHILFIHSSDGFTLDGEGTLDRQNRIHIRARPKTCHRARVRRDAPV